jgi:hypothetical protein
VAVEALHGAVGMQRDDGDLDDGPNNEDAKEDSSK